MNRSLVVLLLTLGGCASQSSEMVACPPEGCKKLDPVNEQTESDPVRRRAVFDLQCERDKIEIVEIDYTTRGARGCGKQATYKQRVGSFDWFMDSAVVAAAPPPAK